MIAPSRRRAHAANDAVPARTLRAGLVACALGFAMVPGRASGQSADSLRLADLQRAAVAHDPRGAQVELLREQSSLRIENLRSERLPTPGVSSQAQHQSDVTSVNFPGAMQPFKTTYDANLGLRLRLLDPSRAPRTALERAQLAESEARVATTLFAQRQAVNDAFFNALLLQVQREVLEATIADLEVQHRLARERVAAGASLAGDAAMLEAELLRRRQSLDEVGSSREAALDVLGHLTGRSVAVTAVLHAPATEASVRAARRALDSLRGRPEYQAFTASREVTLARETALQAQDKPRLSAFGRSGYGRPGLNMLSRDFATYWLAGVQLEWSPFDWGVARREREAIALQRRVIETEERAFAERMRRAVITDLATIDRLERSLATDASIIVLRERVLRETRVRHEEGVVTAGEYVNRETDLQAARLAHATHRVELDQARARFLTTLGLEVP